MTQGIGENPDVLSTGGTYAAQVAHDASASVRFGLLVLSHGAAEDRDQVPAYYAHILHGRPVRPERLEALQARYRAIGGVSPLNSLTRAQAARIAGALAAHDIQVQSYVGFQHTPPFIEAAVGQLVDDGVTHAAALVMTPYYSPQGVGAYLHRAEQAARGRVLLLGIKQWHDREGFLSLLEGRVRAALAGVESAGTGPSHVVFTAHSLPIVPGNVQDPYVEQFHSTARLIAERIGVERWSTCYQSASSTGTPWLGPDILDALASVHAAGARRVVVCPSSFAADNLEVLYDIGIEARRKAHELGMAFAQTAPLNDDPALADLLAQVVASRLGGASAAQVRVPVDAGGQYVAPTRSRHTAPAT